MNLLMRPRGRLLPALCLRRPQVPRACWTNSTLLMLHQTVSHQGFFIAYSDMCQAASDWSPVAPATERTTGAVCIRSTPLTNPSLFHLLPDHPIPLTPSNLSTISERLVIHRTPGKGSHAALWMFPQSRDILGKRSLGDSAVTSTCS